MNCPDCETKLEYEDASSEKSTGLTKDIVAANYYCPECVEYFRWDLVHGFKKWDWGHELSPEQEAHAYIVRALHSVDAGPER